MRLNIYHLMVILVGELYNNVWSHGCILLATKST